MAFRLLSPPTPPPFMRGAPWPRIRLWPRINTRRGGVLGGAGRVGRKGGGGTKQTPPRVPLLGGETPKRVVLSPKSPPSPPHYLHTLHLRHVEGTQSFGRLRDGAELDEGKATNVAVYGGGKGGI